MLQLKKILRVNFDRNVQDFTVNDGIIAIIYYFYIMILNYIFGLLVFKTSIYKNIRGNMLCVITFFIPVIIYQLLPIFIIIKVKKQNLKSIGLKKDKSLKSIFLGIVFSLPILISTVVKSINNGNHIIISSNLILLFIYFLIEIAFVEEIVFRGFIQTRIQGLIKSKWTSIIIVGFMFSLMHIPFQLVRANMPLSEFILNDYVHLIFTFIMHIYFVYIYTRDNNIVSSSITHTLIDFIPSIFM